MIYLEKQFIFNQNLFTLIEDKVKNWEMERIAKHGSDINKNAFTEVVYFKEIPIKVSFNEYIEISKYYSTQNSKVFINGILDKIVSQFKREDKIQKIGRGLI